ncbi:helix-turn-helix transcriptional regulator [Paenibacillus sp. GSMTC-2017]|uniref:helix-turn-helix transcriptional regulator n=1 Tax=Paenibacillus sp. GSMTC-2017 TaxID=2794350 RepID=UPI0018D7D6CE|nr:helix-turn-helix transcriptional regulator [Paenibacillus sp. GSMTC-2017]MBH5320438.1 helix-turn-helix transcriptional regulator [Paenibacillus sp. GSMTC-2017]
MSEEVSYTVDELAKLLKISKLTVYDLIKKGELSSYRVGKQMRVDASDLEAYKQKSKAATINLSILPTEVQSSSIVITGQDISLDILARHMEKELRGIRTLRSNAGSLDSLISMYQGHSDIVSTHLLDGDSGEYNIPYIRKLLIGTSYLVVNLLTRPAGLYVAKGNPLGITNWTDLQQKGLRLVNRERGSGARVLLDEQLRLHGIKPEDLVGYNNIESNHLSVAAKVASGEADVGIGTAQAASVVKQIDFIPLIQERYDLVMLKKLENDKWIEDLLHIIRSNQFQQELLAIASYDLSLSGQVMYET